MWKTAVFYQLSGQIVQLCRVVHGNVFGEIGHRGNLFKGLPIQALLLIKTINVNSNN